MYEKLVESVHERNPESTEKVTMPKEALWKFCTPGNLDVNREEMLQLFVKKTSLHKAASTGFGRKQVRSLVDSKRSYMIAISLAKFKMAYVDIKRAIMSMDFSVFSLEQVVSLLRMVPTAEEMQAVNSYEGDLLELGETEQFFAEIGSVPRLKTRLQAMLYVLSYTDLVEDLEQRLSIVSLACETIVTSERLKALFKVILAVGNELNRGTVRGAAHGFKLDTLTKLESVRSTKMNKCSLMHYVAKIAARDMDVSCVFDSEELNLLEEAARAPLDAISADLGELRNAARQIQDEISGSVFDSDDKFADIMLAFLEEHEPVLNSLAKGFEESKCKYVRCCAYFGEEAKLQESTDFFDIFVNFSQSFSKALKENVSLFAVATPTQAFPKSKLQSSRKPHQTPATNTCVSPAPVLALSLSDDDDDDDAMATSRQQAPKTGHKRPNKDRRSLSVIADKVSRVFLPTLSRPGLSSGGVAQPPTSSSRRQSIHPILGAHKVHPPSLEVRISISPTRSPRTSSTLAARTLTFNCLAEDEPAPAIVKMQNRRTSLFSYHMPMSTLSEVEDDGSRTPTISDTPTLHSMNTSSPNQMHLLAMRNRLGRR
eukprot:GILK01011020.1.p1 GENE.GILK01011020.1~~GILK01011020.1.p1  ORF type:complete len:643 (-),score=78.15 GILK01011020.1:186-1979(-)